MALVPVPITDEQAKAFQEAARLGSDTLETVRAVGGYFSRILGTVPENLIGLLGADWVEHKRVQNLAKLAKQTWTILEESSVAAPTEVPLSLALPLMHAAADESREELALIWARLLASAMDPAKCQFVRRSFVTIIAKFDPLDAAVFQRLNDTSMSPTARDFLASQLEFGADSIEVSLSNLSDLELIARYETWGVVTAPRLTAKGRELKRAL